MEAAALVAEPSDERTLRLRAGPDAEVLKGRSAVLFGAGALGGHVAVTPCRERHRFPENCGQRAPVAGERRTARCGT